MKSRFEVSFAHVLHFAANLELSDKRCLPQTAVKDVGMGGWVYH